GSLHMEHGSRHSGLSYLKKRSEQDPLSEEASSRLMLALGDLGSRKEVEAEFERLARALSDELESAPLPSTVSAFEKARNLKPRPRESEKGKVVPLRRGKGAASQGKGR